MIGRCQHTWNPGTWPYTKRCSDQATHRITLDDGETLEVCGLDRAILVRHKKVAVDTDDVQSES